MSQYTPNLGGTPDEDARRDAVHVAVAPVVAGMRLDPGCRVRLGDDGRAYLAAFVDAVGVVDPFTPAEWVEEGQLCWVLIYPNTVTSIRHVWMHPAFRARAPLAPATAAPCRLPEGSEAYDR